MTPGASMTRLTSFGQLDAGGAHALEIGDRVVDLKAPGILDDDVEKSLHRDGWRAQLLAQERRQRALQAFGRGGVADGWLGHVDCRPHPYDCAGLPAP